MSHDHVKGGKASQVTHVPLPWLIELCSQGETREPKKDMIYVDSEGNQKHVKDADAKLVEREKEGVHPGKVMAVTGGSHSGLLCEVLALEPKVSLRALISYSSKFAQAKLMSCGTLGGKFQGSHQGFLPWRAVVLAGFGAKRSVAEPLKPPFSFLHDLQLR